MFRQLLTLYFALCFFSLSAQKIYLNESEKSLNKLLIEMRDKYALKFSFDDKLLSRYKIKINKKFSSPEKALEYLLRLNALSFQLQDGVYVIYPAMALSANVNTPQKWEYKISGSGIDRANAGERTSGDFKGAAELRTGFGTNHDQGRAEIPRGKALEARLE